jgi:hypothetical protein
MNPPLPGQILSRFQLIILLNTALAVGEPRYARRLALAWLAAYPGDLPVSLIHARALCDEGHYRQAIPILESLTKTDPEFVEAQERLTTARRRAKLEGVDDSAGCVYALGGHLPPGEPVPEWASHLRGARQAKSLGDAQRARELLQKALLVTPTTPLASVTHLRDITTQPKTQANCSRQELLAIRSLAETYHRQWPACLQFTLILAETLMNTGGDQAGRNSDGADAERAVSLLHQAAAQDVTGQAATRLWGTSHPYRSLWPENLSIVHDLPIPAAVATALGWNQLPESIPLPKVQDDPPSNTNHPNQPTTIRHLRRTLATGHPSQQPIPSPKPSTAQNPQSEILKDIQGELSRLAAHLKQPQLARADGRFPIYVIMTTHSGLERQYGTQATALFDAEMRRLVQATRERGQWGAVLYYADEGLYGVPPAKPGDPWALKLALVDLDVAMARRGERIGAVLIVGGAEVVPFHHLPNPVDDADADVPSDNPYATRDENYFVPEWPVGRLPGGAGNDPAPLLNTLRAVTARRMGQKHRRPWYSRLRDWMLGRFGRRTVQRHNSLGYSAAIWRRASLAVFRPIGDPRALFISPPVEHLNDNSWVENGLGYFNLHGLEDAVEWYGQRDPTEPGEGQDYPVALRPSDLVNGGRAPQVVFSEACYGTHILGRTVEDALSLKFLACGSQAVIGSTCTSYGSVTMPLIAADLLGRAFWKFLREGLPVGEALRRAKVYLAQEMHNRQGYLDGEDQKTLISFALYGDPLAYPIETRDGARRDVKTVLRTLAPPAQPTTVCDRCESEEAPTPIPAETLAHVKSIVARYLPGMADAQLSFSQERAECHSAGHTCPTAQMSAKARINHSPTRQVVVLSKRVEQAMLTHRQYARLTLNAQGKLVKLAVSR